MTAAARRAAAAERQRRFLTLVRATLIAAEPAKAECRAVKTVDLEAEFQLGQGFARVEYYGVSRELYEPQRDGRSLAFILPVVEDGELVDLAAVDRWSQHVGTRLGIGRAFGHDDIANARMGADLTLHDRPFAWLRHPARSVYLFNLGEIRVALDGVPVITCTSAIFAQRVRALFPPSQRDRIAVALTQRDLTSQAAEA